MGVESFRAFRAVTDGESIDRGVAAMSSDELPADGIGDCGHHNGNCLRRPLCLYRRLGLPCDDDVDVEPNEVGDEIGNAI